MGDKFIRAALEEFVQNETALLRLVAAADRCIHSYYWRGVRTAANGEGVLTINGKTAEDIVHQMLESVYAGDRVWNRSAYREIGAFLKAGISSIVWNEVMSVENRLTEHLPVEEVAAAANAQALEEEIPDNELRANQNRIWKQFKETIAEDHELAALLRAYESGHEKTAEIAQIADLKPVRVSELKRKLTSKMHSYMRKHGHLLPWSNK